MADSLFGSDNLQSVRQAVRVPPRELAPEPKFSAWGLATAIPRGVSEAAAQRFGGVADLLGAFGQVAGAYPEVLGVYPDATQRNQADLQRQKLLRDGVDMSSDVGDTIRDRGRVFRADPQSASTAEQLLYGFARSASKVVTDVALMGPAGAVVSGGDEALSAADELRLQGVTDPMVRGAAGAVQGAGLALAALPLVGPTLKATAALYVAGGPGGYIAQQALTREILRNAGQDQVAAQFDPFDPVGLAVASLIPAGFAAWGIRGQRMAAAAKAAEDFRTGPVPSEVSPVADAVRQAYSPEVVDAARVMFATEQRAASNPSADTARSADAHEAALTRAEDQIARGDAVSVGDVAPAANMIEADLRRRIASDFDQAVRDYSALKDSAGGKILNTDTARELSPYYLKDRTLSAAVHEPASQFVKDLYAKKLTEAPGPGELPLVMFTAGGTGAGKTSAVKGLPAVQAIADSAQIIYDTNMNGYASSKSKIEQALAAKKSVTIVMVSRDPEDALVNGALPRAENQRKEFGSGRTVPLAEHIKTHMGALETVNKLADEYGSDPRVTIRVIDNSLGKGQQVERDTAWLAGVKYNEAAQRVAAALEREREAGRISVETYRGFAGEEAGAVASPAGSAGQNRRVQSSDRPGDDRIATASDGRKEVGQQAETAAASARLAQIAQDFPDMLVQMDGMDAPAKISDFLAAVKAEADELAADAPLMEVAAQCALLNGV